MAGNDPRLKDPRYQALRLAILDRDHWTCQIKGPTCAHFATTVDHIIARHDGGDFWDVTNLRAACKKCNGVGGAEIANRRFSYATTEPEYETRW